MEDDAGDLQLFSVFNKQTAGWGCAPLNYPSAARLPIREQRLIRTQATI